MYFATDKDLRKAPQKKSTSVKSSSSSSLQSSSAKLGSNSENKGNVEISAKTHEKVNSNLDVNHKTSLSITETAKIEREQRALKREQVKHTIMIQSWWRGTISKRKYVESVAQDVRHKLNDIEKLSNLLVNQGSGPLIPPLPIVFSVLQLVMYLNRFSKYNILEILSRYCKYVMNPVLSILDSGKNAILYVYLKDPLMKTLSNFFNTCLHSIHWKAIGNSLQHKTSTNESSMKDLNRIYLPITECLFLIIGGGEPYKIKYTPELSEAFNNFRRIVLWNEHAFKTIRSCLLLVTQPLLAIQLRDETKLKSVISIGFDIHRPMPYIATDVLIRICMHILDKVDEMKPGHAYNQQTFFNEFITSILTVPMLTDILSPTCLQYICNWRQFKPLLHQLEDTKIWTQFPELNPPHVIQGGQWLLGNIASLAPFMNISKFQTVSAQSSSSEQKSFLFCDDIYRSMDIGIINNQLLLTYLQIITKYLNYFPIPGVLSGINGIMWKTVGSNMTAVGIPVGLEAQVLSLMDTGLVTALMERIIDPLPYIDWQDFGIMSKDDGSNITNKEFLSNKLKVMIRQDEADIQSALNSNGYVITKSALTQHQEETTWFTSKWAQKTASSMTKSFLSAVTFSIASKSSTQETSNQLGKQIQSEEKSHETNIFQENALLVNALCYFWSSLFAFSSSSSPVTIPFRTITMIAFSSKFIEKLWSFLLRNCKNNINNSIFPALEHCADEIFENIKSMHHSKENSFTFNLITILVIVLRVTLVVTDDMELYELKRPLPLSQVTQLVRVLKQTLYKIIEFNPFIVIAKPLKESSPLKNSSSNSYQESEEDMETIHDEESTENETISKSIKLTDPMDIYQTHQKKLLMVFSRSIAAVLSDLYSRWSRKPYNVATLWEVDELNGSKKQIEMKQQTHFGLVILKVIPWSISFHERMKMFRTQLDAERERVQGSNDSLLNPFGTNSNPRSKGIVIKVRKNRLLEDGMNALSKVGSAIKDRIVVRYVNEFGAEEAGIDVGGLFKDFFTDLSSRIFDPSYGLFSLTTSNLLYPNPCAEMLFDIYEMDQMYLFLGRVLGKAMLENITLQPQFAHFFLSFMHGKYNFMNLVNDLSTLDPELHKNLMFLKTYEVDIEELGLTFSVNDPAYGGHKEIELVPGGSKLNVTTNNRHRYINLVAKYYLHDRIQRQAGEFFSGLYEVVSRDLFSMFCSPELQILISGSQSGISVEDLRQNTRYAGGYFSMDRTITKFWTIVEEFSAEERALLMKFVTSCERPPSLGFVSLQPPFTIQRVPCNDDSRLPTASTCFNTLKLPTYSNQKVMRDKLLFAIQSKSGFDLS